ncbi:MAG: SpoIIE family protein phosphatase [bacterium]|nr:SpoIIE family protein phosphatase [bacterium]
MKNYFLTIDESPEEREIFSFLKETVCPGIITITPETYREGRLFLLAQIYTEIKGKKRRLNTGIRLARILKPERVVIFYKEEKPGTEESFLVDFGHKEGLQENIRRALDSDESISWPELDRQFEETYVLMPHDDQGLKNLWDRQRALQALENKNAGVNDTPKEILFVDDEFRYFQKEMETVVKRRCPNWKILWASDEEQAEIIISGNYHLDMVILDLEFRGDNIEGMDLLQKLRGGRDKYFFFPIIVFSRCRDVHIIEELVKPMEVGVDDYISKYDVLEEHNFDRFVNLMAWHMEQYDKVHDMQKILAPDVDHRTERFHIYGKSNPFVEVGGDVIDFIEENGVLTVYLADAINHGFDAGLLSGMFKASVKTKLLESASLPDCIDVVDSVLCRIKKKSQKRLGFVLTAVLIQFTEGNRAEIVNAGHLPILHYRAGKNQLDEISLKQRDRAMGMMEKGKNRQTMGVDFNAGDLFVLFSDGISETKGRNGTDFDIDGVADIIRKDYQKPLDVIYNNITEAVRKHGRQTDDRTLMLIRVNNSKN